MKNIMIYSKHKALNIRDHFSFSDKSVNFFLIYSLFLSGIILSYSLFTSTNGNFSVKLSEIIDSFLGTNHFVNYFFIQLSINIFFVLSTFAAGLCSIGIPLLCVLPIAQGLYTGIYAGFYFSSLISAGYSAYLMKAAPGLIIFLTITVFAYDSAFKMSSNLVRSVFLNVKPRYDIKLYIAKFFIITLLTVIASLISTITMT